MTTKHITKISDNIINYIKNKYDKDVNNKHIINILKNNKISNETFGMSCEECICNIFNLKKIQKHRVDKKIINNIKPILTKFFIDNNIKKLNYTGNNGNFIDFIDDYKKTYSIKSNKKYNDKVCPQKIGQLSIEKFTEKIYLKITKEKDPEYLLNIQQAKQLILNNPQKLFKMYYKNLFCCDNLIYIKLLDINFNTSNSINIIYLKNIKYNYNFSFNDFIFTKNINNWNESNTIKLNIKHFNSNNIFTKQEIKNKYISIGEFQIHKNRNCIKFRFNFKNLLKLLIK
jgi:hypothetical protein